SQPSDLNIGSTNSWRSWASLYWSDLYDSSCSANRFTRLEISRGADIVGGIAARSFFNDDQVPAHFNPACLTILLDIDPKIKRCLLARRELRRASKEGHLALSAMLTVSQLSKSFAGRALFDDVSLQVNRGDRIGLVGPNGAGKSTLFALLLGDVSPDKGTIAIEKNATIGFLPQETAAAGDETVVELALTVSPELVHAQKVIKEHEAGHEHEHQQKADDVAYHKALHVFDEHGGWELEPKAKRVLAGLAFRETDFDRPARALSGGWVMRAHLARLLVMEPDLLLLDEPTNHLDLESLQWFQ